MRKGLCGMKAMFFLNKWSPTSFVFTPSISMLPSSSMFVNLKRACNMEDFPAPVLPTTPTFIPASTLKFTPFKEGGKWSLYFMITFLNSMFPD
eukprot:CAMPEP_0170562656 /NCGR_PEP_ID=MMETSP0211-20121228/61721_1 /TAXON_ID=311385 /ORGANISM="Pseudokeronopsis sp., Strain OXSARD2" /LENGTH=92 /DNA_ID=CAMNT_0010879807 /DNA_START=512 /DNA_END=790 /DNA_ORIENTATION=+